ncbi:MAG: hypothetical protein ACK5PS_10915 [Desulfopila sp.]
MTPEQRNDLAIEWRLTSNRLKEIITKEYHDRYGEITSREHWEQYLVEALNLETIWKSTNLS